MKFVEHCQNRQSSDKFRNQAVANEVFRFNLVENLTGRLAIVFALHFGRESDTALFGAVADDLLKACKRATANKQDVGGINLQKFLLRMLASALRWYRSNGTLDEFE